VFLHCIGSLTGVEDFQLWPGLIRDQPRRNQGYPVFRDPRPGAVSQGVTEAGPRMAAGSHKNY